MFQLHFLGRGAAFYPAFGNTNAWFEHGKDLFFLDFGEEAYHRVVQVLPLEKYEHVYVLLTHLHADHVGSLASLCSYMTCVLHRKVIIVHPLDTVVQLLKLQGIADSFYTYLSFLPEDCGISAVPIEVQHAKDMKAFGYLLRSREDAIYYSGDAAYLPGDVLQQFLGGKLSRIYHDTASRPSEGHCWYPRLVEAVPQERRRDVYCMHLDMDNVDMLKGLGFSVVEVWKPGG